MRCLKLEWNNAILYIIAILQFSSNQTIVRIQHLDNTICLIIS